MLPALFRITATHANLRIAAFFTALVLSAGLQAQLLPQNTLPREALTIALDQQVPMDPRVKAGKFSNGLHYFIIKNTEPKNRAELRLVVDAGSVLEDDDQVGLAHFLEHMAFNGTQHFQKQKLIGFMESLGMKMGGDINASTSFDETVYQLQLPTDNQANLATAFQIIEDWATSITLDPAEIDSERGVVIEEWRLGQGAQSRIRDKQFPVIMKDSRYATRLPIGTLDNLQHFKPEVLRRFYHDWYRPDLMTVIAVGDFEVADIEKLMQQHLASIPAAINPRPRQYYDVPPQQDTLFTIATDKEVPLTQVALYHKMPAAYDWTIGGERQRMVEQLYNSILNTRFQELVRKPGAPFLGASSGKTALVRQTAAYAMAAVVQENGTARGLQGLLDEAERVARFGFTSEELERQKTDLLRAMQQYYANRDSRTSASHAAELIRHTLTGESVPSAEYEVALYNRFVPGITLAEVDQVGKHWITPNNRVVLVTEPDKPGVSVPTAAELGNVITAAANDDIKPSVDTTTDKPLLAVIPKGAKVTATHQLAGGLTEWELANGIKVVLKPTDFKKDEIMFSGFRYGGTSLASDEDFVPASTAVTVIANGGVGDFTSTELQHKLTGKLANVMPNISDYSESIGGAGSVTDLETLFQLLYLRMTAPRADATFYELFKQQMTALLPNRTTNPAVAFEDTFNRLMSQNNPRRQPPSLAMMAKTDLAKSLAFYKDRLGDASGFTFIFVGSFDPAKLQPLVETYIGGLPTSGRQQSWKDVGIRPPTGIVEETVKRGLEPKSSTRIAFTGPFDSRNQSARVRLNAVTQILQTRLRNVMREQLGGTYNVQVSPGWSVVPTDSYVISINFGSDPARADELTAKLFSEIEALKQSGPTETEFSDTRLAILRTYEQYIKQNNYWLSALAQAYTMGEPGADGILSYPATVNAMTVDEVHDAFKQYFNVDNHVRVTLMPEK